MSWLPILLFFSNVFAATPLHYFKNSIQIDIPVGDGSFLIKGNGCGAFLIKNDGNRILLGTARHCFGYNEYQMCDANNDFLETHVGKCKGHCKNLVASSLKSDFFIFEADFGDKNEEIKNNFHALTFGIIDGDIGARALEVYGYPNDIRKGLPTKTYSCYTFSKNYDPEFLQLYSNTGGIPQPTLIDLVQTNQRVKHNCSIYAGNSGGPMIVSGSIVIGLPLTYQPGPSSFESYQYGLMETLNNLYFEKSALFEKLKISKVKIK